MGDGLAVCSLQLPRDCRFEQCGEPNRWSGWSRYHANSHGGVRSGCDRIPRGSHRVCGVPQYRLPARDRRADGFLWCDRGRRAWFPVVQHLPSDDFHG